MLPGHAGYDVEVDYLFIRGDVVGVIISSIYGVTLHQVFLFEDPNKENRCRNQ